MNGRFVIFLSFLFPHFHKNISCEQRCERRYGIQESYRISYEKAVKEAKEDILNKYSTTMSEQIADEIRNWFKEYQNRSGKFPEFPTEENGGSRQLLSRQGILNHQYYIQNALTNITFPIVEIDVTCLEKEKRRSLIVFYYISISDSELSRSSPVSSRDSKRTKEKSKTPTKIIDLTAEVNFESGFKMNQSSFLNEIKFQIDE